MITDEMESIVQKMDYLENALSAGSLKIDDTYSLGLLQPLLNGYPFLPFTGSSLRPFCLNHIINDIVINARKRIIEFGSGLSTIIIGRLIKKNKLNATIVSVEHDAGWVDVLSTLLRNENLDDVVDLIYAPLKKGIYSSDTLWYDTLVVEKKINETKFDMVIVDGPPAWEKGKDRARYPALPFMVNRLNSDYSVYLDDANRMGEQSIIQSWKREHNMVFHISGGSLAFYCSKNGFYTEPFVY
jgi:predicted O-methyltransferase YrrM